MTDVRVGQSEEADTAGTPRTPAGGEPSWVRQRRKLRASLSWGPVPIGTILATVGIVVGVYLAGKVLYRLRDIVLIMVVGAFVALLLNPMVAWLQRLGLRRRGLAVAVVTVVAMLVFGAIAFAFGSPLVRALTHFAHALPAYVKDAEAGHGWIGHLVRHYHIVYWVKKNSPKIVSFAESLSRPVLAVGKGALAAVAYLVVLFFFVLLLLLEAPKMKAATLGYLAPTSRERWRHLGDVATRSVSRYMLGNLTTSAIAGVLIFVTLTIVSVPFPFLWALWVGLVDFLPEVGGALAGIPTVLFAFTHSLTAGIVTAIVFLVYWQMENRILNPVIMSRTVRINPLVVFLSVIVAAAIGTWVGGTFGGFAAALIAIPAAAMGQAAVRELRWSTRGRSDDTTPRAAGP